MLSALFVQLIFILMRHGNCESCIEKSIVISKRCQIDFYAAMMKSDGRDCRSHFDQMESCLTTELTCHTRIRRENSEEVILL